MFKFDRKVKNRERKKKGPVWLLLYMCIGALIGGILGPLVYGNYYEVIGDSIIEIGNLYRWIYRWLFRKNTGHDSGPW